MIKLVKVLLSFLLVLAILIIAGIVALFTLIDPNKYKTQIQNQIRSATSLDVEMKGAIHWSIYPTIGIDVENVIIKNPEASQQQKLADVASASVQAKLIPLFRGQIQIDAIRLDSPKIYLVKDANGKGNWIRHPKQESSAQNKVVDNKTKKLKQEKSSFTVSINSFEINNGTLSFRDLKKDQTINLSNMKLQTKNISKNMPVDTSFKLDVPQQNIHSNIAFKTLVNIDEQFKNISLNDIYLELDQSTLRGRLAYNSNQNAVDFKIDIDQIDLDRYVSTTKTKQQANEDVSVTTQNLLASADNNLTAIHIQSKNIPNVNGVLQIQKLIASKVAITDIKAVIATPHANVIKIAPLTARAYEGDVTSNVTIDMSGATPLWHVTKSGNNLQIAPMLKDLANKESLTGTFSFTANIVTKGTTKDELLRNLSGDAKLNLKNGAVKNIDINQAITIASQLFNRQSPSSTTSTGQTDFANFAMTANFQDGVMTTNDLMLSSSILLVVGKGSANLVTQAIHFNLLATVLGVNLGAKVQRLQQTLGGIPLEVTGTFSNYHIQPDNQLIMNAAAKELINKQSEKVQNKVNQFLQKNNSNISNKLKGLLHQ